MGNRSIVLHNPGHTTKGYSCSINTSRTLGDLLYLLRTTISPIFTVGGPYLPSIPPIFSLSMQPNTVFVEKGITFLTQFSFLNQAKMFVLSNNIATRKKTDTKKWPSPSHLLLLTFCTVHRKQVQESHDVLSPPLLLLVYLLFLWYWLLACDQDLFPPCSDWKKPFLEEEEEEEEEGGRIDVLKSKKPSFWNWDTFSSTPSSCLLPIPPSLCWLFRTDMQTHKSAYSLFNLTFF